MPFLNDEVFVLFCQFLCSRELPDFHSSRFPQLDGIFHVENGFTVAFTDVNVNGSVIVAVKSELESVLFKDQRYERNIKGALGFARSLMLATLSSCERAGKGIESPRGGGGGMLDFE